MDFKQARLMFVLLIAVILVLLFCLYSVSFRSTTNSIGGTTYVTNKSQTAIVIETSTDESVITTATNWLTTIVTDPAKAILAIFKTDDGEKLAFTSLPSGFERAPISLNNFIKLIVINTNPGERVKCSQSPYAYEFFVLFTDNTNTLESSCGMGGNKYDYAFEITQYLSYSRGFPTFTKEELTEANILIGDGKAALAKLH